MWFGDKTHTIATPSEATPLSHLLSPLASERYTHCLPPTRSSIMLPTVTLNSTLWTCVSGNGSGVCMLVFKCVYKCMFSVCVYVCPTSKHIHILDQIVASPRPLWLSMAG